MPLARTLVELKAKRVDLVAPMFQKQLPGLHISIPHVYYRAAVFTLAANNLSIDSLSELGAYSIATFQGAGGYFGPDFVASSKRSPLYVELSDMSKLVELLLKGRVEVVVLDFNIFHYYLAKLQRDRSTVQFHDLFPLIPAVVAFVDPELRDQFQLGLVRIRQNGQYQQILNKYLIKEMIEKILATLP